MLIVVWSVVKKESNVVRFGVLFLIFWVKKCQLGKNFWNFATFRNWRWGLRNV